MPRASGRPAARLRSRAGVGRPAPQRLAGRFATLILALGLAGFVAPAGADPLAEGDVAWAGRARGQRDGRAAPGPIEAAIAAYERALAADPASLEVRWKLLRALHYAGEFSVVGDGDPSALWDRAIRLAEESVAGLASAAGGRLEALEPKERKQRLAERGLPASEVARLYFWSAIVWGAWSREIGLIGAVREGVASRLHDYTRVTLQLEPGYDAGGPYRLLGRLHARLPRVPLFSGWVDRSKALPLVEAGYALAPWHPGNRLVVAITLEELAPERAVRADELLREVADLTPREAMLVEDLSIRKEARKRLAR